MPDATGHIGSYSELIDAVVSTLARGDVAVEAATWIAATELELFRDCNVTAGDQKKSGTISADSETLDLPIGTISISQFQLDLEKLWTVKPATLDRITQYRESDRSGIPKFYWRYGETLELGPATKAGGTTAYTLWYYGLPAHLGPDNPTNELARLGWDVYLYGALMHSAPYIGDDPRLQTWGQLYHPKKDSLKKSYWRARLSGVLETRPDFYVNDSHTGY